MKDFQENIVPALAQNSENVFIYNNENSKLKILFVGNSITKHAPKPSIGWTNDCGMAASSLERDYVHIIIKRIMEQYDKNVSFAIAQVAEYERTFFNCKPECSYKEIKDFDADIIITFYGANVTKDYDTMENPPKTFAEAYEDENSSAIVVARKGYLDNVIDPSFTRQYLIAGVQAFYNKR